MNRSVAIKDKSACCGCGACAAICPKMCIKMLTDKEGFRYPSVDADICINCGKCMKACPWECVKKNQPKKVYAAKAKNNAIQYRSSSGGAFEVIAYNLIEKGYIVYGAAYSENFSSVAHVLIDAKVNLGQLRGSKYVQSDISNHFNDIRAKLNEGVKILFSGTGCQVAALKSYLGREYDNLITVDILCHGVPSPLLYKEYIESVNHFYGKIFAINMKDKTEGWGHQKLRIKAVKEIPVEIQDLWYKIFYSRIALRPSCYNCLYMDISRPGDISLGDYWGIENVDRNFFDKKGVSLLLINTSKGKDLLQNIIDKLNLRETGISECLQPVLSGAKPQPEWRDYFWKSYEKYGFTETIYRFWGITFGNKYRFKMMRVIKRIIGQ